MTKWDNSGLYIKIKSTSRLLYPNQEIQEKICDLKRIGKKSLQEQYDEKIG